MLISVKNKWRLQYVHPGILFFVGMAVASTSASSSASVLPQNLPTVCEDCLEPGVLGGENKRG